MSVLKKDQYSFEIVISLVFLVFIAIVVFFYSTGFLDSSSHEKDLDTSRIIGERVLASANELYHKETAGRNIVKFNSLESLSEMKSEGSNLVITVSSLNGEEHLFLRNDFPISTKINKEDLDGGVLTIESDLKIIMICGRNGCHCEEADLTVDGIDQNCDGVDGS